MLVRILYDTRLYCGCSYTIRDFIVDARILYETLVWMLVRNTLRYETFTYFLLAIFALILLGLFLLCLSRLRDELDCWTSKRSQIIFLLHILFNHTNSYLFWILIENAMNECRTISNDGTWMSYHLKWWYSHGKRIYGNVGSSDPKVSSLIHLTTHSHTHIGSLILALHSARYSFSGTLRFLADLSFSQIFIQWNSLVPGRFDWCFPFSPSETFGLHWLMFSTFHFVQISSNLSIPTVKII